MTPWEIEGLEFVNCNCAYGCPCQFNARPTHGNCEALGAIAIEKGHYGEVGLDGLRMAFVFQWPGAIHEGRGRCQPIVDERANDRQRDALLKIMSGEDSEPGKTMFHVFASTMEKVFEPALRPIEMEVDVDGRRSRIHVDGFIEARGEPIRNPVTGQEHRARIDLPAGFEYAVAEVGSGSGTTSGPIAFELEDSHGQFVHLHLNNYGPVRA